MDLSQDIHTWVSMAIMPRRRKHFPFLTPGDGYAYVFGGYSFVNGQPIEQSNAVDRYNPATDSWTAAFVCRHCEKFII